MLDLDLQAVIERVAHGIGLRNATRREPKVGYTLVDVYVAVPTSLVVI